MKKIIDFFDGETICGCIGFVIFLVFIYVCVIGSFIDSIQPMPNVGDVFMVTRGSKIKESNGKYTKYIRPKGIGISYITTKEIEGKEIVVSVYNARR